MKKLLFICTGNTCRSPLAEVFTRKLAEKDGFAVEAKSAGTHVTAAMPASLGSQTAALEYGTSLTGHISQPVTQELLSWADYVYCVTEHHLAFLTARFPDSASKLLAFSSSIPDPFGQNDEAYHYCAAAIWGEICRILKS